MFPTAFVSGGCKAIELAWQRPLPCQVVARYFGILINNRTIQGPNSHLISSDIAILLRTNYAVSLYGAAMSIVPPMGRYLTGNERALGQGGKLAPAQCSQIDELSRAIL